MAKVFDPTDLSHIVDAGGTTEDLEIQTGAKTIEITTDGNIVNNLTGALTGVTGKCVYSKLKEIWKTDNDLNKHKFPIQMIYEASFVWINGWGPLGQPTRDLIRDAGFQESDGRENACIISLGAMDAAADQPYYVNDFATEFAEIKVDFTFAGEINENIQTKGIGGSPDDSGYLKVFLREEQKTFASYDLISEQTLPALKFEAYRLPVANGADLDVVDDDTAIGGDVGSVSGVKYSELTIDYISGSLFEPADDATGGATGDGNYQLLEVVQDTAGRWARCTGAGTIGDDTQPYASFAGTSTWEAYPGERLIGTTYYAFNRILMVQDTTNGYSARLQEIHSWAQFQLRQAADINDDVEGDAFGTINGNIALPFTYFIGSTLHTQPGVYIDDFDNNDKNDLNFWDITIDPGDDTGGLDSEYAPNLTTVRIFPFTAAGNINFSQNFVDEVDNTTRYTMYFQYIKSQALTAIKVSGSSGADCTFDWTGADVGLLDFLQSGDYVSISGFTTETGNNGLYEITGAPTTNTITASKVDGVNPTDEATGDACTVLENPFESPKATIVDNNSAADIDGEISAPSIAFDFDYTNNAQEGRTPNANADVYVVAVAYDGAQYVLASHTITKTTGQNVPVNAVDELNYENP